MYGGHITDNWDRRTNNAYLKTLIKKKFIIFFSKIFFIILAYTIIRASNVISLNY